MKMIDTITPFWTLRDLKVKLFVRNKCLLNVLLTSFSHMVIFFESTYLYFKEQDSKRVVIKPLERGSKILSVIAFNVDREEILLLAKDIAFNATVAG